MDNFSDPASGPPTLSGMSSPLPHTGVDLPRLARRVDKNDEDVRSIGDSVVLTLRAVTAHTRTLAEHTSTLEGHTRTLDAHTSTLAEHTSTLEGHTQLLTDIEMKVDSAEDGLSGIRVHQEIINTNVRRADAKVAKQGQVLDRHTETLATVGSAVDQHTEMLGQHTETLGQHTDMLSEILRRLPA